jgi:hypothetical protein
MQLNDIDGVLFAVNATPAMFSVALDLAVNAAPHDVHLSKGILEALVTRADPNHDGHRVFAGAAISLGLGDDPHVGSERLHFGIKAQRRMTALVTFNNILAELFGFRLAKRTIFKAASAASSSRND